MYTCVCCCTHGIITKLISSYKSAMQVNLRNKHFSHYTVAAEQGL